MDSNQQDTNQIIPMFFSNMPVRLTLDSDGNPWWIAKDVCAILEINNNRKAVSKLDDDEKDVTKGYTLGGEQEMTIINESGLYALIIRSNKPQARAFRKWVTAEVLPAIRKTGHYGAAQPVVSFNEEQLRDYSREVAISACRIFWETVQTQYKMSRIAAKPVSREEEAGFNRMLISGRTVAAVARAYGRARSTVRKYTVELRRSLGPSAREVLK